MDIWQIRTFDDAHTWVCNSGALEWDWGDTNDRNMVLSNLTFFVYQHRHNIETRDEMLAQFILQILDQDPLDYGL